MSLLANAQGTFSLVGFDGGSPTNSMAIPPGYPGLFTLPLPVSAQQTNNFQVVGWSNTLAGGYESALGNSNPSLFEPLLQPPPGFSSLFPPGSLFSAAFGLGAVNFGAAYTGVPEPSSLVLGALGVIGIWFLRPRPTSKTKH